MTHINNIFSKIFKQDIAGNYSRYGMTDVIIDETPSVVISGGKNIYNTFSFVKQIDMQNNNIQIKDMPNMPKARYGHAMISTYINSVNHLVISGGINNRDNILKSTIYLDTKNANAKWQHLPIMPQARAYHAMISVSVGNKHFLVMSGGCSSSNDATASVYSLDLTDKNASWVSGPDMPQKRSYHEMYSQIIDGDTYIVVFGGRDNHLNMPLPNIRLNMDKEMSMWEIF